MSLLSADPGTWWARTAEPWVFGSSYLLYLVERIVLILEIIMRSRNFNRKFSKSKFMPGFGLELLNLWLLLLGRRLIH
jgi:hypothetical protein